MMTPQQCLYKSIEDKADFSFEEFEGYLDGWEIIPIHEGKELIGTAIRKGNELHVGFIKQGNCIRRAIRQTIGEILKEYGKVVTQVHVHNDRGIKFCHRLGFENKVIREGIITMECVRCNYV
jgi:hypothetical protein